jgi:hypothetical protein
MVTPVIQTGGRQKNIPIGNYFLIMNILYQKSLFEFIFSYKIEMKKWEGSSTV